MVRFANAQISYHNHFTMKAKEKIIVIVGPTASGKTSLAVEIAKVFHGEVISADSRQVYRGLDIGTGKVTPEEMDGVPHHLIDVRDPDETYTAADFVKDAERAITDITARGNLPIIAGGTLFYVDVLLGNASLAPVPPNPELRAILEEKTNEELFAILEEKDAARAKTIDRFNKRRLVRALEILESPASLSEITVQPYDALVLNIDIDPETLRKRINTRLKERLDNGMIEESEKLHANGLSYDRMEELGLEYRYISRYLRGMLTREELHTELQNKIWQYARRQMTWLRKMKNVQSMKPRKTEEIRKMIQKFLA